MGSNTSRSPPISQFPADVIATSTKGNQGAVVPHVLAILSSLLCRYIATLANKNVHHNQTFWLGIDRSNTKKNALWYP
jgi:hypothetical protein